MCFREHDTLKRKAVSPVIATIILLSSSLVLALVVGAYTFGLFGSNVKTLTISSIVLYGGVTATANQAATSSFGLSVNNPGSATTIASITLTGSGITPITIWDLNASSGSGFVNFSSPYTPGGDNGVDPGTVSQFTFYPFSNSPQMILSGETLNYVISFANGESVSGTLVGQ